MSERITRKHLDGLCRTLNRVSGHDEDEHPLWVRKPDGSGSTATVGMYYVDGAYGGWALHRMVNEGGGCSDVLGSGHVPARDLYYRMHAYLDGLMVHER